MAVPARPTPARLTPVRVDVTPIESRRAPAPLSRQQGKHAWTLVIVPPQGGVVRTLHVRRWQLRLFITVVLLLGVTLLLGGFTTGARFASEPFAATDAELAEAETKAAALGDTLRAIRIATTANPNSSSPRAAPEEHRLVLPVDGPITSRFTRARLHPILGIWRPHLGVDMSAPRGTRITSPAPGRVRLVEREFAAGLVVELEHGGGVTTRYLHLRSATVQPGQRVAAGATIGTVGSSGLSTGPHLHWEVRVNGRPVDPLRYRFVVPEPPKPTPPVLLVPAK